MEKFTSRKFTTLLFTGLAITLCFASFTWANTLSFIKMSDANKKIEERMISEIPQNLPEASKTRAPEPTTLALFGGSILGMIISLARKTYTLGKRLFDIFFSLVAILILTPSAVVLSILIKITSKGPIFFTQVRVGKDGRYFTIYKFRTMHINAEKESGPVWAKANDNRLISIGKILRKSHLDEIPQFINVLKGDMSIIGPRPERPIFVEEFKKIIPDYEKRLLVKPGITGLAQVWHKYDETIEDVRKKIHYDILYIKKLCFWTDLRILFRTFKVVLTGEGAH